MDGGTRSGRVSRGRRAVALRGRDCKHPLVAIEPGVQRAPRVSADVSRESKPGSQTSFESSVLAVQKAHAVMNARYRIEHWYERLGQPGGTMTREDVCFLMVQTRHLIEA